MSLSERMTMPAGPGKMVKKILVAGLDENDKPVFSTVIVGTLEVNVETDRTEVRSLRHDFVVSSWDVPTDYEIIVRGRPVEQ